MTTGPNQRIRRLAPVADVEAAIDRLCAPVAPETVDAVAAIGCVLAADIAPIVAHPTAAIAIADGWAVESAALADAGPYAPVALAPPVWVDAGEVLPQDCDAVATLDTIMQAGGLWQALAPASPGDGVTAAGGDAAPGTILRAAGERLRLTHAAVLKNVAIPQVLVRRPHIAVVTAHAEILEKADAVAPMIAADIARHGGIADIRRAAEDAQTLSRAFSDPSADAVITIGGTGCGRQDRTVLTLAAHGEIIVHGMGVRPGETAGLGAIQNRPVLMLPGRLDAAFAIWLAIGRRLLRRLMGATESERGEAIMLSRKIASAVGFAELVLIRRDGENGMPLASARLPLRALTQADGWLLVAPESEGYSAGALVTMFPMP